MRGIAKLSASIYLLPAASWLLILLPVSRPREDAPSDPVNVETVLFAIAIFGVHALFLRRVLGVMPAIRERSQRASVVSHALTSMLVSLIGAFAGTYWRLSVNDPAQFSQPLTFGDAAFFAATASRLASPRFTR